MLWLHIGMPKTGTTALQTFLRHHHPALDEKGIHFMHSGREAAGRTAGVISHNNYAFQLNRGWRQDEAAQIEAFETEYEENKDKHCVLTSEMFFDTDLSPLYDRLFKNIKTPVQVVTYLRRFDDYIEAEYKQRAKNGRAAENVEVFTAKRVRAIDQTPAYLNFERISDTIEENLPGCILHPRIYQPADLVGENTITDFQSLLGLTKDQQIAAPARSANRTLSRISSEALGLFSVADEEMDKKRQRRLYRKLQGSSDPLLFGKGDVFTFEEREDINSRLEERNATFRKRFFPDRDRLFRPIDEAALKDQLPRGSLDEVHRFQHVVKSILKLRSRV